MLFYMCFTARNFLEIPTDAVGLRYGLGRASLISTRRPRGILPVFQAAGGWSRVKRIASRIRTTSKRKGPIDGRKVCARGWQWAGLLITKPCGVGDSDGTR